MENELLKINIMSIAVSGLLMLAAGIILYLFKDYLSCGSVRFMLPLPPIAVAAYIFVFNMFKHYQCCVPGKSILVSEIIIATITSTFFFFVFTIVLIFLIALLKGFLG
jgi:hypothetical protein